MHASPFWLRCYGMFVEWQFDKFLLHHLQIPVDRRQLGYDGVSQLVIRCRSTSCNIRQSKSSSKFSWNTSAIDSEGCKDAKNIDDTRECKSINIWQMTLWQRGDRAKFTIPYDTMILTCARKQMIDYSTARHHKLNIKRNRWAWIRISPNPWSQCGKGALWMRSCGL